ncbi:MAG: CoA transferase, partial [Chloroflexales bacterium]|nr:CoA transferase [Chloroflexales bacterium]
EAMNSDRILSDIRVIEVAAYIPGPVCTQILADLGATVIKVERPGGDPMRHMGPRTADGVNPMFLAFNRDKEFVELDLKTTEGAAKLRDLAQEADILLDGFRPGVLTRLSVGAEQLQAINPRLIYCALSGYGATGPQQQTAGHDLNYVSLSGLLALTTVGGVPALPGTQIADMVSGLTAVTAILVALYERNRSGKGSTLDIAISDSAFWLMAPWLAVQRGGDAGQTAQKNMLSGALACYNLYRTADKRYLAVAALEPRFWANFCTIIERPDLIALQYAPTAQPMIQETVAQIIATRSLEYWTQVCAEADTCVTPVLTLEEASRSPLYQQRRLLSEEHPGVSLPIRFVE